MTSPEANTPRARDGVLDVMERSSVNVDVVYMDAYNAPLGSDAYNAWVSQLGQKVAQHGRYAAVICADDEALYFMENNHDSMFPSTPSCSLASMTSTMRCTRPRAGT